MWLFVEFAYVTDTPIKLINVYEMCRICSTTTTATILNILFRTEFFSVIVVHS